MGPGRSVTPPSARDLIAAARIDCPHADPHRSTKRTLDPKAGRLIALKPHILTCETLGWMRGLRLLEGTFLGGCLFSGGAAGPAAGALA